MGMCTSDPLGHLISNYGEDVSKYIVSIKSEEYLNQLTPKMIQKLKQRCFHQSNNLNTELDARQKTINDYFDGILTQTLKQSRAALQGVKQRQKKTQEQIFGLTKIHQKFKKLKSNKDQKLKEYQQQLVSDLQKKKNELIKDILQKRPELPILEQMPFWLKSQVEADSEMKFSRQVKIQEERLLVILQKVVHQDDLQKSIKNVVGMQEADQLGKAAHSAFQRIKRSLTFSDNPRSCFV